MKKNSRIDNIVSEEIKKFIIKESKKDIVDKIIKESVEDAVNNAIEEVAGYNKTMKKAKDNFDYKTLKGKINRKLFPKKFHRYKQLELDGHNMGYEAANALRSAEGRANNDDDVKYLKRMQGWSDKYGTRYTN